MARASVSIVEVSYYRRCGEEEEHYTERQVDQYGV